VTLKRLALVPVLVVLAGCDLFKPGTQPGPVVPENAVLYSAVGASDAIGIGASVPCLPFVECPNGTGYVPVIAHRFYVAGKDVTLLNLGIPGAVLNPEIEGIGNSVGRDIPANMLEREGPFVQRSATLVTIFAGGNDANAIGAAMNAGAGANDPNGYIANIAQNFGRDFRTLIANIRARAPDARIVVFNLPNLAMMPYASGYTLTQKRGLQQIAVALSQQINSLVTSNVLVLDLMCDGRWYQSNTFSSDGFHPSDTGYAFMADLGYAAATSGTATAPRSACSQMTNF